MIAAEFALPAWLAGLQLAISAIVLVQPLGLVRYPQSRRKSCSAIVSLTVVAQAGPELAVVRLEALRLESYLAGAIPALAALRTDLLRHVNAVGPRKVARRDGRDFTIDSTGCRARLRDLDCWRVYRDQNLRNGRGVNVVRSKTGGRTPREMRNSFSWL